MIVAYNQRGIGFDRWIIYLKGLACLVWAHLHTVAMNENRLLRFASLKIKNWQNNLRDERNSFYSILYLFYLIIFILIKIMISITIGYQKSLLRIIIYDCIADVQYLFMVQLFIHWRKPFNLFYTILVYGVPKPSYTGGIFGTLFQLRFHTLFRSI